MRKFCFVFLLAAAGLFSTIVPAKAFLTELRSRGYSLIPAPQKVELEPGEVVVDNSWGVDLPAGQDQFIGGWLIDWAKELHRLELQGTGKGRIVLRVVPGTVKATEDPALNDQGYSLEIAPARITITGNAAAGLFYGVQSLLQLLKRNAAGELTLPEGKITDWPDLQLRFAHWDTKHHQLRPEALRRLLDWLAFFKVNCIGFEMEDKYEYPSHPVIGAPGAYTKHEMQDLTRYAMQRQIQLVPVIQAPAHFSYVLKHEEFAHLRADGNNYQACMCDEEAIQLIFDMYRDMIEATPGVKYFHVSTDEVYYAGICSKCKRPYNEENRSQAWVDFAVRAHDWLAERGRRMLAWVEYPLLPKDILKLPPDLINGVMSTDREFLDNEKKVGIRQLAYSSTQGAELLFPNHFPTGYRGREDRGRLEEHAQTVRRGLELGGNPIGSFAAAWDDSGLHEECFWIGWATVTQYAWTCRTPAVEQSVADFMDVFYGPDNGEMLEIYRLLENGARFFEDGWENVVSKERGPGYGNSNGKGIGTTRTDEIMLPPAQPAAGKLAVEPVFGTRYRENIERAREMRRDNDRLLGLLNREIAHIDRNRYSLEVFLSIARLEGYFIETLLELDRAEKSLVRAAQADSAGDPATAVAHLTEANNRVAELLTGGDGMWKELVKTWEKSRYPKNRTVNGRQFLHVLDDVKDHFADRRVGLEYMIAPFERMQLPEWRKKLEQCINDYAAAHNVPVQGLKQERLED